MRVTNELCDRIEAPGHAELVEEYNYELPFYVIAHILGIPESDFPFIKQLAWDFARAGEKTVTPDVAARGDVAARAFEDYFGELSEKRRGAPEDDLMSSLVEAEADGERLTHTELVANCIVFLQAGHETTQDLLGNAAGGAVPSPRPASRSCASTPRSPRTRSRSSSATTVRCRSTIVSRSKGSSVDDDRLPPGAMLYVFLGAVNRDPERYREPDRLDITATVTHHLAFSFGAYYCLGAALARIEIAVGIRTLLDRFPWLRPARTPSSGATRCSCAARSASTSPGSRLPSTAARL